MTAAQEIEKLYADYLEQFREQNGARRLGQGIFGMGAGPGDLPCHGQLLEDLKSLLADIAGRGVSSGELREALEVIFSNPVELQGSAAAAYWTLLAAQGVSLEVIEDMGPEAMEILYPELGSFKENYNLYAYRNLDAETLDYINTLWENVKIN